MKAKCLFLILSCSIYFLQNGEGARILGLFAMQGSSHFIMFEEMMKALADAGHQVDIVSHFPRTKPYPNYTDIVSLNGTRPSVVNNMNYELMEVLQSLSVDVVVRMAGNDICDLMSVPGMQDLIKNPPTDPPYDIVVTEFFYTSCYFAFGRHLKVPVVAVSSASVMPHSNEPLGNPLNPAIVSEIADRPISTMNFWQRLQNTIVIFFLNLQVRYYMKEQNAFVKKYFGSEMPDIEQLERELSLLLINSHPLLHGVRPLTPAIVEVSGLHVQDDDTPIPTKLQKWLDDSKDGFIYFSLGSMVKIESFPRAALAEVYSAFTKVAPIRILMKVAKPEELPPGLPDNVLTLNWAPQKQILKHKNIRGFITHGGLMGLQEAVTYAVPLIGMPLYADQMGNIDICVHRGIAIALDYKNLKADKIVAAINAVTHDPKYINNMKTISKQFLDRPMPARETAVFWIEYILRNGGDALRSPAIDLAWWQLELLDIYGTILAALLIVLYILKRILTAILNRIFHRNKAASPSSKKRN